MMHKLHIWLCTFDCARNRVHHLHWEQAFTLIHCAHAHNPPLSFLLHLQQDLLSRQSMWALSRAFACAPLHSRVNAHWPATQGVAQSAQRCTVLPGQLQAQSSKPPDAGNALQKHSDVKCQTGKLSRSLTGNQWVTQHTHAHTPAHVVSYTLALWHPLLVHSLNRAHAGRGDISGLSQKKHQKITHHMALCSRQTPRIWCVEVSLQWALLRCLQCLFIAFLTVAGYIYLVLWVVALVGTFPGSSHSYCQMSHIAKRVATVSLHFQWIAVRAASYVHLTNIELVVISDSIV
jgi:hypothetical protein